MNSISIIDIGMHQKGYPLGEIILFDVAAGLIFIIVILMIVAIVGMAKAKKKRKSERDDWFQGSIN